VSTRTNGETGEETLEGKTRGDVKTFKKELKKMGSIKWSVMKKRDLQLRKLFEKGKNRYFARYGLVRGRGKGELKPGRAPAGNSTLRALRTTFKGARRWSRLWNRLREKARPKAKPFSSLRHKPRKEGEERQKKRLGVGKGKTPKKEGARLAPFLSFGGR